MAALTAWTVCGAEHSKAKGTTKKQPQTATAGSVRSTWPHQTTLGRPQSMGEDRTLFIFGPARPVSTSCRPPRSLPPAAAAPLPRCCTGVSHQVCAPGQPCSQLVQPAAGLHAAEVYVSSSNDRGILLADTKVTCRQDINMRSSAHAQPQAACITNILAHQL
jgi:hypothetical protein